MRPTKGQPNRGGISLVFSDGSFLFLFLPGALVIGLAFRTFAFAPAILLVSLLFYYWTGGTSTLVLLAVIVINYGGGVALALRPKRWVLSVFIALDLLILGYFKYAGFLAFNFAALVGASVPHALAAISLPVGISFFTFQGISYLIDIYRGDVAAEPSPIVFGAYISFFPQLIAGPIVRYSDVAHDFHNPQIGIDRFAAGAARFAHGLLKKVLIADNVAGIADAAFTLAPSDLTFVGAWLGTLAFAVQIYFDFSGYSDMAIGLGEMFGIGIPENFNHPYSSRSITDSGGDGTSRSSSWFRDYLFIPLGGSRRGTVVTYGNLLVVFLLVGFWHGAAWNFVAWGAYNGCFLIFERIAIRDREVLAGASRTESVGTILARLLYCAPGRVDRLGDLSRTRSVDAVTMIVTMFSPGTPGSFTLPVNIVASIARPPLSQGALFVGSLGFLLPADTTLGRLLGRIDLPVGEKPLVSSIALPHASLRRSLFCRADTVHSSISVSDDHEHDHQDPEN